MVRVYLKSLSVHIIDSKYLAASTCGLVLMVCADKLPQYIRKPGPFSVGRLTVLKTTGKYKRKMTVGNDNYLTQSSG